MISIRSWPRRVGKASSRAEGAARSQALPNSRSLLFNASAYRYDLVSLFTHLAAVATANVTRDQLFQIAASLGYRASPFFGQVLALVRGLSYDFAHACHRISSRASEETIRAILLRFGNSLASGEPEAAFLHRELRVITDDYVNEYERDLESLRKWTDAFVALEAAAIMIVLVAVVSNMIYHLGNFFLVATEMIVLVVGLLGAWLIWRVAPADPMLQKLSDATHSQKLLRSMATVFLPAAVIGGIAVYVVTQHFGMAITAAAIMLAPPGLYTFLEERKVNDRDRDIADFVRSLGSVTAARGTTVTDSLKHVDRRSIGSLEPELKRLLQRLEAGVETGRAWARFVAETSSDLVKRVVGAFWDAVRLGGDPARAGSLAADLGLQTYLLRSKRRLVASTFHFMIVPLHGVLVALLLFVNEVVARFNAQLVRAQATLTSDVPTGIRPQDLGIPTGLAFQEMDAKLLQTTAVIVAVGLTVINTWTSQAAAGGSKLKLALFASLNLAATGLALVIMPLLGQLLFALGLPTP
jgi:flagellar protein FlaJ